jgi:hypothetical protein
VGEVSKVLFREVEWACEGERLDILSIFSLLKDGPGQVGWIFWHPLSTAQSLPPKTESHL